MHRRVRVLLSLPKSLYVCCKSMKIWDALKLPIIVAYDTALVSLNGKMTLEGVNRVRFGLVRVGFGGAQTALHHRCAIENNGVMSFGEHINFGGGTKLCTVNKNSVLRFGNHTSVMGDSHIVAKKDVRIGADCIISWDTQIMDTDFHDICHDNKVINHDKPVEIRDHVWIGSKATILKGTTLPKGTIVGACAVIQGKVNSENTIITGLPIRTLKDNCIWKHTDISV